MDLNLERHALLFDILKQVNKNAILQGIFVDASRL